MRKISHLLLFTLLIFCTISSCKKKDEEIGPAGSNADPNATVSAEVNGVVFNGYNPVKSNTKGFTLKTNQEAGSITIGTDLPPTPGQFELGRRDPFSGKNYFAIYVSPENIEYRTKDGSGTLTITGARSDGDQVRQLAGTFSFKAFAPDGSEVNVTSGTINFTE